MMMVTVIAAWTAVSFPGGDWSDLAKSIGESTKQDVYALAGAREAARPFEYNPDDLNELARAVQSATGFRHAPGLEHVFYRERVLSSLIGLAAAKLLEGEDHAMTEGSGFPASPIKDGLVTVRHKAGQATLLTACGPLLPKPVVVHWLFERLAFKAWTTDTPAAQFMANLAKGVGGRLVARKDDTYLDIDPAEVRRRALKTLDEMGRHKGFKNLNDGDKWQWELSRAALGAASNSQIAEAFATPDGKTKVAVSFGMKAAIQRHLSDLMQQPAEVALPQRAGEAPVSALDPLRRIDPRINGYLELNGQFQARLFLQTLDQLGRPGPYVAVP